MIKNDVTFDEYLSAYRALHPTDQRLVRGVAAKMLKAACTYEQNGVPDIGSSDISNKVFSLYKQYGGFTNEMFNELTDEWITNCWGDDVR